MMGYEFVEEKFTKKCASEAARVEYVMIPKIPP
jgi:hypothetical protein